VSNRINLIGTNLGDTIIDAAKKRWRINEIDDGYRWCSRVEGKDRYIQKFSSDGVAILNPKGDAVCIVVARAPKPKLDKDAEWLRKRGEPSCRCPNCLSTARRFRKIAKRLEALP
jgi:hypothetical protein